MGKRLIYLCLVFVISSVYPLRGSHALTVMNDEGMKEAIEYGKTHTLGDIVNDPEWTRKGNGDTYATLVSAFKMIALKSAQAKNINREFTIDEARALCVRSPQAKELGALDTVVFFAVGFSPSKESSENFIVELRQVEEKVSPVYKENDPPVKNPHGLYYVHYRLYFPIAKVDIRRGVTLSMKNREGDEWKYDFDLAKVR